MFLMKNNDKLGVFSVMINHDKLKLISKPFRKSKQIEDLLTHKNSKNFCREIWIPKPDTYSTKLSRYIFSPFVYTIQCRS